jgi:hypothetical protein
MKNKLAIFDIDGTLCDTYDVDAECFMNTAVDMLGAYVGRYDWRLSPHVTDAGIINWLWQEIKGRPPTKFDLDSFCRKFMSDLSLELSGIQKDCPSRRRCLGCPCGRPIAVVFFGCWEWGSFKAIN